MTSKLELRKEILLQHKQNQKIVSKIKNQLTKLMNGTEVVSAYINMYQEQGGEVHDIGFEHISIAKDYKNLSSRGVVDRLFLETFNIIHKIQNKSNTLNKTTSKSSIMSVGMLVSKIKDIDSMTDTERQIIHNMLKDLQNDLK